MLLLLFLFLDSQFNVDGLMTRINRIIDVRRAKYVSSLHYMEEIFFLYIPKDFICKDPSYEDKLVHI